MLELIIEIQKVREIRLFLPRQFERHTLHGIATQLSIIITGLLTPNGACNIQERFKDGRPMSTCQSQNALCGTQVDIQQMPKTVSQYMRIGFAWFIDVVCLTSSFYHFMSYLVVLNYTLLILLVINDHQQRLYILVYKVHYMQCREFLKVSQRFY